MLQDKYILRTAVIEEDPDGPLVGGERRYGGLGRTLDIPFLAEGGDGDQGVQAWLRENRPDIYAYVNVWNQMYHLDTNEVLWTMTDEQAIDLISVLEKMNNTDQRMNAL